MRRLTGFICEGAWCAASIDVAPSPTGLLIVSGGNEIRAGAHAGQAALAARIASAGYPVFRFDRRGVGDSEGDNGGFESSAADIAAALAAFRREVPQLQNVVAFGNCDAASAAALFHEGLGLAHLILANPWSIDAPADGADSPAPSAAAIRARYWARLKNPRSLIDLLAGRIDLQKLASGLNRAACRDRPAALAARLGAALSASDVPTTILLARRDQTAATFRGALSQPAFAAFSQRLDARVEQLDSASHSFADAVSAAWLEARIAAVLASAKSRADG